MVEIMKRRRCDGWSGVEDLRKVRGRDICIEGVVGRKS